MVLLPGTGEAIIRQSLARAICEAILDSKDDTHCAIKSVFEKFLRESPCVSGKDHQGLKFSCPDHVVYHEGVDSDTIAGALIVTRITEKMETNVDSTSDECQVDRKPPKSMIFFAFLEWLTMGYFHDCANRQIVVCLYVAELCSWIYDFPPGETAGEQR